MAFLKPQLKTRAERAFHLVERVSGARFLARRNDLLILSQLQGIRLALPTT
jgi:hypothetical protein